MQRPPRHPHAHGFHPRSGRCRGAAAVSSARSNTGATALSVTPAVAGATTRNPRYLSHMASYDDDVASSIWQARPRKEEKLSARVPPGDCCSPGDCAAEKLAAPRAGEDSGAALARRSPPYPCW